jgi:regulator of replication initiation timing
MDSSAEKLLITQTIRDIDENLERLNGEREKIRDHLKSADEKIAEMALRREQWQSRLNEIIFAESGAAKPRRKRGLADQAIYQLFKSAGDGSRFSIVEIAQKTGLPWSSINAVLKRKTETYAKEGDGNFYRLKVFSPQKVAS